VQTARQDHLVVCERGGPQNQAVELHLSTDQLQGTGAENRENLAWRVRLAASLVALLSARHLPYRLIVDGKLCCIGEGASGKKLSLQRLAEIPLDAPKAESQSYVSAETESQNRSGVCWVAISQPSDNASLQRAAFVKVEMGLRSRGLRQRQNSSQLINLDDDITGQLNHWLSETIHV